MTDEEEYRAMLEASTPALAASAPAPAASAPAPAASTPASAASAPIVKRPSIADAAKKVAEKAPAVQMSEIYKWFQGKDPAVVAAALGGANALWLSGAGVNPFNPTTFLQYDPRYPKKDPTGVNAYTRSQVLSNTGTNDILAKELSAASGTPVRTTREAQAAITAVEAQGAARTPITKMVNGVPTVVRYAQAAGREATPLTSPSVLGRIGDAMSSYLPGVKSATDWAKGALPTLGAVAKSAGTAGQAVDVGARLYTGDKTGAGISAAGAIAPWLLGPEVGIPASLAALGANYLRDNPDAQKLINSRLKNAADSFYNENSPMGWR